MSLSSPFSPPDSSLTRGSGCDDNTVPQKLLILDARSYTAAVANRAKGGGCECEGENAQIGVFVFFWLLTIFSLRTITIIIESPLFLLWQRSISWDVKSVSCLHLFLCRVLPKLRGDVHGNGQHPRHPQQLPGSEDSLQPDPWSRKVSWSVWPFSLSSLTFICASLPSPLTQRVSPHRKPTPHRGGSAATALCSSCWAGQLSVSTLWH